MASGHPRSIRAPTSTETVEKAESFDMKHTETSDVVIETIPKSAAAAPAESAPVRAGAKDATSTFSAPLPATGSTASPLMRTWSNIMTAGIRERRLRMLDLVRWCAIPVEEQNRLNREHIDRHVVTWDKAVQRANKKGKRASRNLIFLHVPKTGGSTLDNIIPKNYDIKAVIHMNFKSIARNSGALWKEGRLCRVILGHFQVNQIVYQAPTEAFAHIAIMREPVARLVSLYNFLATARRHPNHKASLELPFDEFVRQLSVKECHNGQTLRLAGMLRRTAPTDPKVFELALARAKENIEHRLTLFGLTERYSEFLVMAQKLLHWNDPFYTKRKVTKDSARRVSVRDLSPSVLEQVREQNRYDIELYDWALDLFDRRAQQLGITKDDVEEFNRRNKAYTDLRYD